MKNLDEFVLKNRERINWGYDAGEDRFWFQERGREKITKLGIDQLANMTEQEVAARVFGKGVE